MTWSELESIARRRDAEDEAFRRSQDFQRLSEKWHRVFGEVKCWSHERCHVCRDTGWPLAWWVR